MLPDVPTQRFGDSIWRKLVNQKQNRRSGSQHSSVSSLSRQPGPRRERSTRIHPSIAVKTKNALLNAHNGFYSVTVDETATAPETSQPTCRARVASSLHRRPFEIILCYIPILSSRSSGFSTVWQPSFDELQWFSAGIPRVLSDQLGLLGNFDGTQYIALENTQH